MHSGADKRPAPSIRHLPCSTTVCKHETRGCQAQRINWWGVPGMKGGETGRSALAPLEIEGLHLLLLALGEVDPFVVQGVGIDKLDRRLVHMAILRRVEAGTAGKGEVQLIGVGALRGLHPGLVLRRAVVGE